MTWITARTATMAGTAAATAARTTIRTIARITARTAAATATRTTIANWLRGNRPSQTEVIGFVMWEPGNVADGRCISQNRTRTKIEGRPGTRDGFSAYNSSKKIKQAVNNVVYNQYSTAGAVSG